LDDYRQRHETGATELPTAAALRQKQRRGSNLAALPPWTRRSSEAGARAGLLRCFSPQSGVVAPLELAVLGRPNCRWPGGCDSTTPVVARDSGT
jgi:hypothetical protein